MRSDWALFSRLTLLVLIGICLGCHSEPSRLAPAPEDRRERSTSLVAGHPPPSLLLVTIDTWRWDYVGAAGTRRVATPVLDRLAAKGFYAREILTPCPLTTPSHGSILTGLLPEKHGILNCTSYSLRSEGVTTLAERFRREGYRTAAFISGETLKARYGLNRGFDLYDDSSLVRRRPDDWLVGTRSGEQTTSAALNYLGSLDKTAAAFVWVHYFDLHTPYRKRPAYDERYQNDAYAAQVAFVDDQIGRLIHALRRENAPHMRILVVGDHGEGLGDHGERGHGIGLYRSTMHVPLILFPAPKEPILHEEPFSLVDIAPTVLEWFELPQLERTDGESLFSRGTRNRILAVASLLPSFQFLVNPALGLRRGDFLYIKHGEEELYDVAKDPDELRDLTGDPSYAETLSQMRDECSLVHDVDKIFPPPSLGSRTDVLQRLGALGYVGGSVQEPARLQRVDLRKLLRDKSNLERIEESSFLKRDYSPLVKTYEDFLADYPRANGILKNLGHLLATRQKVREAAAIYERVIRNDPDDAESLARLGSLYVTLHDPRKALPPLESALALDPDHRFAHKVLAIALSSQLGRPAEALPHFKRHLELVPNDPEAAKIRAAIAAAEGQRPQEENGRATERRSHGHSEVAKPSAVDPR